jgi:predicted phage tail protein
VLQRQRICESKSYAFEFNLYVLHLWLQRRRMMDAKKLGGAIVAAAGVIIQVVVQAAGFKLNPIAGGVLLFLCGIAVVVGVVLFFLPKDKSVSKDEALPNNQTNTVGGITTADQSGGNNTQNINL